jgi:hypothetical protein
MKKFLMRIFVEVDSENKAKVMAYQFVELVREYCSLQVQEIKQYWKISEYFEIVYHGTWLQDWKSFRKYCSEGGWCLTESKYEKDWVVWNFSEDNEFILPEVKWANIELNWVTAVS